MNAYITHKDTVIRLRSGRFDVHVGDHAPYKQFASFEDLEQAKAFIDAGRVVTNQVVYWTESQAPVVDTQQAERDRNTRTHYASMSRAARRRFLDD